MSGPLAPALGTLFAPAAAGAATTGLGTQILGGLVAGIGSGLMKKAEYKQQRDDDIAAEERRANRYSGAGDAMRSWGGDENSSEETAAGSYGFQRVDANSNRQNTLGDRETTERMGQQYRKPKAQQSRYRFDRASGAIVMA